MAIELPISRRLGAFPYKVVAGGDDPGSEAHHVPHGPGSTPRLQLLPQRFFEALFRFGGKFCVRDVADFLRKFTRDSAHVFELLRVPLAK